MTAQSTTQSTASVNEPTEVDQGVRLSRLFRYFHEEILKEMRRESGQGRMKNWALTYDGRKVEEEAMRRVIASGAFAPTENWVPVRLRRAMDGQ